MSRPAIFVSQGEEAPPRAISWFRRTVRLDQGGVMEAGDELTRPSPAQRTAEALLSLV
jgi:hypothetical protein